MAVEAVVEPVAADAIELIENAAPVTAPVVAMQVRTIREGRFTEGIPGSEGNELPYIAGPAAGVISRRKEHPIGAGGAILVKSQAPVHSEQPNFDRRGMDVPSEELAALALAAQRGEAESRDALIRVIRPVVLRYALARGLRDHDADDVTQEVCVAVLQAIDRWRDEGRPVWAVVFAIVRNKLADLGRAAGTPEGSPLRGHDRPRLAPP